MKNKFLLKTLKEPFVLLMVGPPLTGKSTAIKSWLENYNGKVEVISRDAILLEEHGSDDYSAAFNAPGIQKKADKILISKLEDANANRSNVIIDMTNLNPKRRGYNLSFFDEDYYKVAVLFPILSWDEFSARNEKRKIEENKFIPEHVIKNMVNSYSSIKDDEEIDKVISYD